MKTSRLWYALTSVLLLGTEVLIALFVNDAFIRPYGGDILVTVLICCMIRIAFPAKCRLLPLWVFLFAVAVEFAQYFDFVTLLGLGGSPFFRTLLGTSFAWLDIVCYGVGCLLFWGAEILLHRHLHSNKRGL